MRTRKSRARGAELDDDQRPRFTFPDLSDICEELRQCSEMLEAASTAVENKRLALRADSLDEDALAVPKAVNTLFQGLAQALDNVRYQVDDLATLDDQITHIARANTGDGERTARLILAAMPRVAKFAER